jgi:hypothetical protein
MKGKEILEDSSIVWKPERTSGKIGYSYKIY